MHDWIRWIKRHVYILFRYYSIFLLDWQVLILSFLVYLSGSPCIECYKTSYILIITMSIVLLIQQHFRCLMFTENISTFGFLLVYVIIYVFIFLICYTIYWLLNEYSPPPLFAIIYLMLIVRLLGYSLRPHIKFKQLYKYEAQ